MLRRDQQPLGEVRADGTSNYSVALFEMADRLLASARVSLSAVELFAAATGPGSFTGIRVGLAAAQAWAKAFDRPVRGVSVLDAMVAAAGSRAAVAVPLLDARRSEFYLGVFRRESNDESHESRFSLSGEGLVLGASAIATVVEEIAHEGGGETEFVVRENDRAALELSKQLPRPISWKTVSQYHAEWIARTALRAARDGHLQRPEELDAWYIRRSDAEVHASG